MHASTLLRCVPVSSHNLHTTHPVQTPDYTIRVHCYCTECLPLSEYTGVSGLPDPVALMHVLYVAAECVSIAKLLPLAAQDYTRPFTMPSIVSISF